MYCNYKLMIFRYVSDLYFRPNKVRTWSGNNQSLSGFEKIRMVGKGMHYTVLCQYVNVKADHSHSCVLLSKSCNVSYDRNNHSV